MIGTMVSIVNQCVYCIQHHAEALNFFWKDDTRISTFIKDYTQAGLKDEELLLCRYADLLSRWPASVQIENHILEMKKSGLSNRAVLDITLVIAYFNFVNRIVLGLGVNLEADGSGGYKYDG